MKAAKVYKKFDRTVTRWEKALDKYSEQDLKKSPGPGIWTVGQVYEHITASTLNFHAKQIEQCLQTSANREKRKSKWGYLALIIDRIPPVNIPIPPEENVVAIQPPGKPFIREKLQELRSRFSSLADQIDANPRSGKTGHPGMGYLLAVEWFALIEMHLRYHWKDKRVADKAL